MLEVEDKALWIHKPICLPLTLEAAYLRERATSKKVQEAQGLPVEAEWAYFERRCT